MIEPYALLYAQKEDENPLFLKSLFKNVYTANTAKAAWEIYKEKNPKIVVLDMNLSDMNILEIASKIRTLDKQCKIVILANESETTVEELLFAIKLHLTEYIIKPINAEDLAIVVRRAIEELKEDDSKVNLLELANNFFWDKKLDKLYKNDKEIKLTKKETELLKLLSSKLNSAVPTDEIMKFIYDNSVCSTSKFRTLLYRLKLKIDFELVESIYAIGYKLKVKNKK